ncbi:diacylglycerol/lipid kinase family protein [Alkalithermobacter paradoxus]|uniref:Diacylglycerol kinase n=1 Tax=Alkalithermobacter paradoxus TaxID=29349 RepID=A0A1V4I8L3_9FIRM|nr:diacylglycerol kinase [[Clostridium] thermoalcaliphilum]
MRVKIINNPSSGRTTIQKSLHAVVGKLVLDGVFKYIDTFNTSKKFDATNELLNINDGDYDLIVAVGGDGTLNEVVNGVMKSGINTPVALIPAGTVNDFGNFLSIPTDVEGLCSMIKNGKIVDVDIGKVNDNYFANVAAAGFLTDVPFKASVDAKTTFGKFAYYAEAVKELQKQIFNSIPLEFKYYDKTLLCDTYLFAVLNTSSTGGFRSFAPHAKINDGMFDVCIIKKSDIIDAASIFLKIIRGEHINDENVVYFQTDKLSVNPIDCSDIHIDIDGEDGGLLPVTFQMMPKAMKFLVPKHCKID